MSTYLVTGAAGFIGAAIAKGLNNNGHRVITIDNLSTGFDENIPAGVEFFKANCQDTEIYKKIPQLNYEAIFHIAGQSSGEISFDNPAYDLQTNTESTLHLLKFALSNGCHRFIYASTMSVYGIKPDRPISEKEETRPESFYGVGKIASEHYLRLYEKYGIRSTSLRLFNVYGPGQNMKNLRQGMVSIFLAQMLKDKHIHIKGAGDRFRDFVYIDDVVDAFMACLSKEDSAGKVINVGTGTRTTVAELIDIMIKLYGQPITTNYQGSTAGDIQGIVADIKCLRDILGINPKISLPQGLKRMMDWAIPLYAKL